MERIGFGIVGCGLMGREFASAMARWCHLLDMPARPELVAICDRHEEPMSWFTGHFPTIAQATGDYRELLDNDDVDAVYVAVPHHLHAEVYTAAIRAGKHLMGEKPFGIDRQANRAINQVIEQHPQVFVRCVSQFPFFPAVQRIGEMLDAGAFGRIIEVQTGFLHSSDLDRAKPINWKRQVAYNGAYGVMGDLGMHACHVPLRAGWRPKKVHALLRNLVTERPAARGDERMVPCDTWDNATLLIESEDPATGEFFPWSLRTHRIAPGEKNTWYVEILGTEASARFSTRLPRTLEVLHSGDQVWQQIQMGCETAYPTITGGIFEFGFSDAILQMWASFVYELCHRQTPSRFAGCVRPDEVAVSHRIFTEALEASTGGGTD